MLNDNFHPVVIALRGLAPGAIVSGGSFSKSLPHPSKLNSEERRKAFEEYQQQAIDECLCNLLLLSGSSTQQRINKDQNGYRIWPSGFIGSLTHKGTVVLAIMVRNSDQSEIGIDLERHGHENLQTIQALVAPENIPVGVEPSLGTLLAFSVKESIFKAQFPSSKRLLKFSDVSLAWRVDPGDGMAATGRVQGGGTYDVRCALQENWVITVATPLNTRT